MIVAPQAGSASAGRCVATSQPWRPFGAEERELARGARPPRRRRGLNARSLQPPHRDRQRAPARPAAARAARRARLVVPPSCTARPASSTRSAATSTTSSRARRLDGRDRRHRRPGARRRRRGPRSPASPLRTAAELTGDVSARRRAASTTRCAASPGCRCARSSAPAAERGDGTRGLTLASAGHPPPLLVRGREVMPVGRAGDDRGRVRRASGRAVEVELARATCSCSTRTACSTRSGRTTASASSACARRSGRRGRRRRARWRRCAASSRRSSAGRSATTPPCWCSSTAAPALSRPRRAAAAASSMTSLALAEREPHERAPRLLVVVEDAGRDRHDARALDQLAAERHAVAPQSTLAKYVPAGRSTSQPGRLEPGAQLVALDAQLARERGVDLVAEPERDRARVLERRAAGEGEVLLGRAHGGDQLRRADRPAGLPARDGERLAERGDRQRALGHAGRASPAGRARRRRRGARRPRR